MGEVGCLKDGHFQNLMVENTTILGGGDITMAGRLILPGGNVGPKKVIPVKLRHSGDLVNDTDLIRGIAVDEGGNLIADMHLPNCEHLFNYLAGKDSLTVAESTELFQTTGAASLTSTITEAVAGALTGADGYATTLTPQFLTGNWAVNSDIGASNPIADLGNNTQHLIIFGGNTYTGGAAHPITFTSTTSTLDASAANIIRTGAGDGIYVGGLSASGSDKIKVVLTPAAGCVIQKGSFIYVEKVGGSGANSVIVKGFIRTSVAALAITATT